MFACSYNSIDKRENLLQPVHAFSGFFLRGSVQQVCRRGNRHLARWLSRWCSDLLRQATLLLVGCLRHQSSMPSYTASRASCPAMLSSIPLRGPRRTERRRHYRLGNRHLILRIPADIYKINLCVNKLEQILNNRLILMVNGLKI